MPTFSGCSGDILEKFYERSDTKLQCGYKWKKITAMTQIYNYILK